MARTIAIISAAVIIIGTGVLHGYRSNRWGEDVVLTEAVARMDQIPQRIGDWVGTDHEILEEQVKAAEASRVLARNYVNEKDGRAVSLWVVCGRPGPVAVHTPDICFVGSGQVQKDEQQKYAPTLNKDSQSPLDVEFWTADFFRPKDLVPRFQRVFWSWSKDGEWEAPQNPRSEFMWNNKLYKIYIIRTVPPNEELEEGELDPAIQFGELLVPELNKALFGDSPSQASS